MLLNYSKRGVQAFLSTQPSHIRFESSYKNSEFGTLLFKKEFIQDTYRKETFCSILRSLAVIKMCTMHSIAGNQDMLIKLGYKVLGKRLFEICIRNTLYKQFIAGENIEEVKLIINKLKSKNVGGILDYGAEADLDSQAFGEFAGIHSIKNRTEAKIFEGGFNYQIDLYTSALRNFVESIELATFLPEKVRFTAIKITALGDTHKMQNMNSYFLGLFDIFKQHSGNSTFLDGDAFFKAAIQLFPDENDFVSKIYDAHRAKTERNTVYWYDFVDIFYPEESIKKLSSVLPRISLEDITEAFLVRARVDFLCKVCVKHRVKLIVDAEQTYFQKYFHYLVMELEQKYNKDSLVLYNTLQTYLKKAYEDLVTDIEWSLVPQHKFKLAIKMVRGAYVEQERRLAHSKGGECAVCDSYDDTNKSFHEVLQHSIKSIPGGNFALIVASHNQSSVEEAVQLMRKNNVEPSAESIVFAQLLGMGDYISHVLAKKDYNCIKCLPYGPVDEVFPYIVRRVRENRSVLDRAKFDLSLLASELGKRITMQKEQ